MRLAQWSTMLHFGRLACHPTSDLSLCCFSYLHSLRVPILASPCSPRQVQCSTPPLLLGLDYPLLFMFFSFLQRVFNLLRGCARLCSWGLEGSCVWCVLLTYWVCRFTQAVWNGLVGRNSMLLFLKQTLPRTGFSAAGHREACHRLGIQDAAVRLWLILYLPSEAPMSWGGFWSHRAQDFWFLTLIVIFDLWAVGLFW
jgi:hypothetical protein